MQTTIQNPISCYGIGVHSGKKTQLTLKPASKDAGVVFIRTDVTEVDNQVLANYASVSDSTLATSISNTAGVKVTTIEHLMAALWGCGIDNVLVEIDGAELPVMDGSSKPFVFMIECSGKKLLNAPRKYLKLLKSIKVEDNGSIIEAIPAETMSIDLTIDFQSSIIGRQNLIFSDPKQFNSEIADARTFGFLHELDYLQSKGLAKGASLDNAIGIDNNVILNHDGLRHKNEFVRHKILDMIGDFYTSGGSLVGAITSYKPSHSLNNQFLHKLFNDPYSYEWVSCR
jgi:UDP-3-O-[3-hydroxymyristoyl] N-acetylglucosamine deacetylase